MKNTNTINLIFDFDGTLVDSFSVVLKHFNALAQAFNFKQIKPDEINNLKLLNSKELIKHLKIPIYKIPAVLIKARALMKNEIKMLPPFAHLDEVLKKIHQMDIKLGIVTSNSLENVKMWLAKNNMKNIFNFIHNEPSYFGKKRILKRIIKSHQMGLAQTFYIGDETRDIESANACHIGAIAVTWGFNAETVLKKYGPHFIARRPEDILTICEKIKTSP